MPESSSQKASPNLDDIVLDTLPQQLCVILELAKMLRDELYSTEEVSAILRWDSKLVVDALTRLITDLNKTERYKPDPSEPY